METAFEGRAREEGNGVGYDTIAAAGPHACTLHWIRNDGPVREGDLVLVDAGVEVDSLYTADVTRTLPVNGTFTPAQAQVYEAVLDAADAAFAVARPGTRFRDVHGAAMQVIAERLHAWGLLPGSRVEESLDAEGQFHRRWMVHGTSHHLGLDVHDCAQARREMYLDARTAAGHGVHDRAGAVLHRRRPAGTRRSSAASASGSRTTSWSPRTAARTSPPCCRARSPTSRPGSPTCPNPPPPPTSPPPPPPRDHAIRGDHAIRSIR